jgi:hypothetical protein
MTAENEGAPRGDWMQTYGGGRFYLRNPRADEVEPADIAHALSLLCRYNGHIDRFYSVAEHCVLLSHAVPEKFALDALLHDATEAYVGDMIRPLKRTMNEYQMVERYVMNAIAERFDITNSWGRSYSMPAEVCPTPRTGGPSTTPTSRSA